MPFADDLLWKRFYLSPSGAAAEAAEEVETEPVDEPAEPAAEDSPTDEPTAEDEPAEKPTDEPASLGDVWKQHNLDSLGLPSDPTELQRQYRALQAQAAEAQRYREYAAILYQQAETQRQLAAQQAPRPTEKPKLPWEIPSFDRRMIEQIMTDENGNLVPRPGAMPNIVDDYRKWQTAREAALDKLLTDPTNTIQALVGDYVQQQAAQVANQTMRQYQLQSELRSFHDANREWIYDQNGQFTPAAQMWDYHYKQALQMGFPNPIQYAEQVLDAEAHRINLAERASQAGEEPPPTVAQRDTNFLKRNAAESRNKPNRSGTKPRSTRWTPKQNGKKDVWEQLREQLETLPPEDFRED